MIHVVMGDLALQTADAVLRPADATLRPVGAAAERLDEVGGPPFAKQRQTGTPLEAGAAVVTGGGNLAAGLVIHVVVADERGGADRDRVRRGLVAAWQQAREWGVGRVAAPLVGCSDGRLTAGEAAGLLVETFPPGDADAEEHERMELRIIVAAADRDVVDDIVGRSQT